MKHMNEERQVIRLNFYPLASQEFTFKVWRKEYKGERREGSFRNLYRHSLPVERDPEVRKDYWIAFCPHRGFGEYDCKQDSNHFLTLTYLYHRLHMTARDRLEEGEYIVRDRDFRKRIFFVLKEYPEGKQTVWLEPYYLRLADRGKFGFLADFKFLKEEGVAFSREVQRLSLSLDDKYRSNRNFYIDKYYKLREFLKQYYGRLFPLKDSNGLNIQTKLEDLPTETLNTKVYVFSQGGTDVSQFRGLATNGPYEPVEKEVLLIFIYRKRDNFMASDLYKALKGNFRDVAFQGITSVMRLNLHGVEKIRLDDFSKDQLADAVNKIKSLSKEHPELKLMPLLIIGKQDDDTYYYMKYQLLQERIPIQSVTLELLQSKTSFKWAVSNIALAILAKLGGKPWKVRPSNERSIIFGIGQSHQIDGGKIVKYFAYSVCTDSSGLYKKMDVLGRSDDEAPYLRQLRASIISMVKEHVDMGYNKYVLHVPFKIKREELNEIYEAIKKVSSETSQDDADFVVMRIDPDNKYFGYAYTNSLIPFESTYLTLTRRPRHSYLVWFEGLQYHRGAIYKRIPGPIYIEFYWTNRELDERERKKYLQDVLNLSGANWRGFNAKNLPISIYYCQLIAKFLKNFPGEVENLDGIPNPWFL